MRWGKVELMAAGLPLLAPTRAKSLELRDGIGLARGRVGRSGRGSPTAHALAYKLAKGLHLRVGVGLARGRVGRSGRGLRTLALALALATGLELRVRGSRVGRRGLLRGCWLAAHGLARRRGFRNCRGVPRGSGLPGGSGLRMLAYSLLLAKERRLESRGRRVAAHGLARRRCALPRRTSTVQLGRGGLKAVKRL